MTRQYHLICPFCHSDDVKNWHEVDDHKVSGERFHIFDCNNCDLRYTQDPPVEADAGPYYDSPNYVSHSDNRSGIMFRLYHGVRKYMLNKKRRLIGRYSSGKKIIDLGSGTGYFLDNMKRHGYEVTGIEINEGARNFSKDAFSLEVYPPELLAKGEITKRFHIATMWHVLEHIYQPETFLRQLHGILEDDALLVIAVPNYRSSDATHYGSYWAGYDVPRHLWHFDQNTITALLKKCGYNYLTTHRLPFDSFYVSMLSEKYRKNALYLLSGLMHGAFSWIASLFNINRTSSLIYFFHKNEEI